MIMEDENVEPSTENPTNLDNLPNEQFCLRTLTNEHGKEEYQVVKFVPPASPGAIMTSVPVALPENVSVNVDHAGRLTFHVSGVIDGLAGELGGSGDSVQIPVGFIGGTPTTPTALNKKSPQTLFPAPDRTGGIRTVEGVLQLGRVSSMMGSVTDCLRIMPDVDPLDCINATAGHVTLVPSTVTPTNNSFTDVMATMQGSLQRTSTQTDSCDMNIVSDMQDTTETAIRTTPCVNAQSVNAERARDPIATSATLISPSVDTLTPVHMNITEVMANMTRTTESQATSSLPGSATVDAMSLPPLVAIGVPNVELTNTGQLVISRDSLVYAHQPNSLLTMPTTAADASNPLKENTVQPNVPNENDHEIKPTAKRKGGWPKGKKRKKSLLREPNVPKAPATAYSLFLNEQLGDMKIKHAQKKFTDIIKILGNNWTKMAADRKKKYLNKAQLDKKRYIDELRTFQHCETYQTLLRRQVEKKIKDLSDVNGTPIDPEVSASVLSDLQLEVDDPNDLSCKVCDQYFNNVHNKKEHMYGKQHLLTLTGKLSEIEKEVIEMETNQMNSATGSSGANATNPNQNTASEGTSVPPQAQGGHTQGSEGTSGLQSTRHQQHRRIDIEQFKQDFTDLNIDREIELRELRCHDQELFELNMQLSSQCQQIQEAIAKATLEVDERKRVGTTLRAKLEGLRMVPTLFGVINF